MDKPLVTCLCLTKNRREWLPKAIECFERQTYLNRELLIVADSMADVRGVSHRCGLEILHPGVVGAKRNVGCMTARGEFIAVWDDDDYSAPERLAYQVEKLQQTGKAVHGWYSMKFSDGPHWWQYRGNASFVLGTSLCFRRDWWQKNPFQEIQCGQDENFAMRAFGEKALVAELDMGLMYATIHDGNTSPRRIRSTAWAQLPGFQWSDPQKVAA
jgi:glycosyltransferase involved in cell wall biosynthesis